MFFYLSTKFQMPCHSCTNTLTKVRDSNHPICWLAINRMPHEFVYSLLHVCCHHLHFQSSAFSSKCMPLLTYFHPFTLKLPTPWEKLGQNFFDDHRINMLVCVYCNFKHTNCFNYFACLLFLAHMQASIKIIIKLKLKSVMQ